MTDSAITFDSGEVLSYFAARVPHLKQQGAELRGPCPIHGGKDDNFTVNAKTGLGYCHSECQRGWDIIGFEQELTGTDFITAKAEVFRLIGRPEPEYRRTGTSTNRYTAPTKSAASTGTAAPTAPDESSNGTQLVLAGKVRQGLSDKGFRAVAEFAYGACLRKVRFEHESARQSDKVRAEKTFRWEHVVDQTWYSGDGGVTKPLYVNRVFKDRDQAGLTMGFEGEAKADLAVEFGVAAFSFKGLTPEQAAILRNCDVVLWPDNDSSGKDQADAAARVISESAQARSIRLLTPPPEFPPAGDIIDAVNNLEWDGARILEFVETSVPWATPDGIGTSTSARRPSDDPDEWPEPEPLPCEFPPVEAFSEDLLPASFRPMVRDVTERMQVPMDLPAVVMILCLAGAVNRRASIQPKANDTGWVVVPNLWGAIILPPGFMKSPVLAAVTRPLADIQADYRGEHRQALGDYAREKEEYDLRCTGWRELYKANAKTGKAAPARPEDEPPEPKLKRLIVNDSTFESLHVCMSENPAGIFVVRDELTGWLTQLDRPGREGERAFCLQAWNGDVAHTIDRIGRGTIHVDACCMSMLGGIQPARLRSYLVDALKDGPTNDGLIPRFQLMVWPDTVRKWRKTDRSPDASAAEQVARVFGRLVELDPENPARFRFAPDSQELFDEWQSELENKVRGDELQPALISHLSKYRSLMPSLALLFELAERASFDSFDGASLTLSLNIVSLEHVKQAAACCDYLESHARRVYSCVVTPQLRAAGELADKIKRKKVGADGSFSCREVYLKGWSGLDTKESVKQAAEVLQDARWIREIPDETGPLGGRPSHRYQINPAVWK